MQAIVRWSLALGIGLVGSVSAGAQTPPAAAPAVPLSGLGRNVLTNQGVALLARSGYSEGFIIDMIFHKETQFDVSAEGLAWLAKQGLTERIVRAMVANERKEQSTAVVPASVVVGQPQAALTPVIAQSQTVATAGGKPVNVEVEVTMPSPGPSNASWHMRGWDRDRWYLMPR
ncbi:MAG: hypothetical protein JNK48_24800 [Bryobacterales bacterium]|nr:hypothetical protein [Bryobacterales bacterium]